MANHPAVVMAGIRQPLAIHYVPTETPTGNEVRVHVLWTASTPLDLHQADGGLLVQHPQRHGDGAAGIVVEVGPDAKNLKVGDEVFGFVFRNAKEKAHQKYCVAPETMFGVIPIGFSMQEAVTLPNNFVTAFNVLPTYLGLEVPWPKPEDYTSPHADSPILIWGGSSSVGQFCIQILKYYGYRNVLATASPRHHEFLKAIGAREAFDYNDPAVAQNVLDTAKAGRETQKGSPAVPFIVDCIGSQRNSMLPLTHIAQPSSIVAVMLPVIIRDASPTETPEYSMDVATTAPWASGVKVEGVRTHFYMNNAFFAEKLQAEIMPTMLAKGIVTPNKQKIVEGATMLERAQKALDMLRNKEVSGERLVWRASDED